MNALTVAGLGKKYGTIDALRGLDFAVQKGSMFGLIGPDGAGKSTFMRIAACLVLQDSGSLEIGGYDNVAKPREIKKIIGYMPQRFSLYHDLSIKENLIFFADIFGISREERKKTYRKASGVFTARRFYEP